MDAFLMYQCANVLMPMCQCANLLMCQCDNTLVSEASFDHGKNRFYSCFL